MAGDVPVVTLAPHTSLEVATQDITKAFIGQHHGKLLMLHAGAVTDEAGRTLAYVAPSGTGKSTLTRLLAREFGCVTDETVGIRVDTLEVLPYPKPVTFGPRLVRKVYGKDFEAGGGEKERNGILAVACSLQGG